MINKYLFRQFRKPAGLIGRIAGWAMALKNRKRNAWLADLIHPKPGYRLLEIGFGPGTVIKSLLNKESDITIWGIDHSEIMVRQAAKTNYEAVNKDKVFLRRSSAENMDFPHLAFDVVYGGNVHLFWENPLSVYKTIYSILKQDGVFIIVYQPRSIQGDKSIQTIADTIQSELESACFKQFKMLFNKEMSRYCLGLMAWKTAGNHLSNTPINTYL